MTSPVDICNVALFEGQTRSKINGFPPIDNSPSAVSAGLFYTPKTQAMMRAANWDFLRRQVMLTQLKAAIINGQVSANPPHQPFQYEYLYPADCLKARFLIQYQTPQPAGTPLTTDPTMYQPIPTANTSVPFVIGNDPDANGNPVKVILTNMPNAMLVYTCDLSQYPDMWDHGFRTAATALLASYFVASLTGDKELMKLQVSIATGVLDTARAMNGNEAMPVQDHIPDWIMVRSMGIGWGVNNMAGANNCQWDAIDFPTGLRY